MIKIEANAFSRSNEFLMRFHSCELTEGERAYENHRHITELEFSVFIKGEGVYRISDVDYEIKPGDIFFVRNNERHSIIKIKSGIEYYNFKFEPRFIWEETPNNDGNAYLRFISGQHGTLKHRYAADEEITKRLSGFFEDIKRECREQKDNYLSYLRALTTIIFVELSRETSSCENKRIVEKNLDISIISKSIDYINTHITEELSLNDIAGKANLSPNYYCNVFKKLYGITLWEYITAKRVELAICCLKDFKGTILDLALSCGFNNTANFNRVFKKQTGITPSQMKKSLSVK